MNHHIIHIKASPKQLSRLRNGHKVRISPAVEGTGFNLIVDPSRYDTISRCFSRGKGTEIQLTPQEISTNQTEQMQGTGIFGKKFDKFLEKNGMKELAYAVGDATKPAVKAAILAGLGAGATALAGTDLVTSGGLGAAAIPTIYGTAGSLGYLANDYLDHPRKYQSNTGGPKNKTVSGTLEGQSAQNHILNAIGQETGNQYNVLGQSNLSNAISQKDRSQLIAGRADALKNTFNAAVDNVSAVQTPFEGLGISMHHHRRLKIGRGAREIGSVGKNASFVASQSHLPPALLSQPFSANFQFQHTLPPAYQKYSSGGGLYA
jgi:hypothetical protein